MATSYMETTSQYDSLGANDTTFDDIPECGEAHAAEGLLLSNNLCGSNEVAFSKPFVGMEFDSLEKSYLFYNEYARTVGFSIRRAKNRRSNIDGELLFQRFCCSKEGHRRKRRENDDGTRVKDGIIVKVRRRNVRSIRVGCSAKLDVKRTTNGRWVVQKFDEEHNHEYAHQGEKHLLRSQRRMQSSQGDTTDMGSKMSLTGEASGSEDRKKKPEKGDVKVALDYFAQMQTENPAFFYAVQVGKDDQMLNLFWADARSRMDFGYFGDVIYFSAAYGTTKYGRPFAPILGVNHHLQTVVFGCAILWNETEESFVWLLETLLKAMYGHHPIAIVTDLDPAMEKAIERVLPGTHHCLSLWHIFQDAAKHLTPDYNMKDDFTNDFKKCIYEPQWCDEFETRWALLLNQYKLGDNEWLLSMYQKRHKWVPIYSRHVFHADMTTIQRIENMNSFFNGYLTGSLPLNEFINQYENALAHRREEEINEDIQSHQTRPVLKLDVPMEQQAADIYTRSVFKEFHKEFCESFNYIAEETARVGTNWTYAVSRWGQSRSCLVNINSSNNDIRVICDCQNFEFSGFLCKHVFKVFTVRNIMLVPQAYFKRRWTKKAKLGVVLYGNGSELQTDCQDPLAFRYSDLCHLTFNFCSKAAVSADAYLIAKRNMEMILRELEKVAEEDMHVTQPDIEHIRSLPFSAEVVNEIESSNHLMSEETQTLSPANQVTMQNPARVGDKRTGFWLRL